MRNGRIPREDDGTAGLDGKRDIVVLNHGVCADASHVSRTEYQGFIGKL